MKIEPKQKLNLCIDTKLTFLVVLCHDFYILFVCFSPQRLSEGAQLNYEQNMHDAIAIMNKLQTGLDVNVKFTGWVGIFDVTNQVVHV